MAALAACWSNAAIAWRFDNQFYGDRLVAQVEGGLKTGFVLKI